MIFSVAILIFILYLMSNRRKPASNRGSVFNRPSRHSFAAVSGKQARDARRLRKAQALRQRDDSECDDLEDELHDMDGSL